MRPDKGLATCVVKVALHEEVQQMGCIAANGAQLGVTTLQDLIAKRGTHVSTPFKECAGKLEGEEDEKSHQLLWKAEAMTNRVMSNKARKVFQTL